MSLRRPVCVIGGGILGLAAARDLALRGLGCVLLECGEPGSGTTTRCVGHLHSGARYAVESRQVAAKCHAAGREVLDVAPFAVSSRGGLFAVLDSHPPGTAERFSAACSGSGIPVRWLEREEVIGLEPLLSPDLAGAFLTPDAVVNPYALIEAHVEDLQALGVDLRRRCRFRAAERLASGTWRIESGDAEGRPVRFEVDGLINAAGPWATAVAAACDLPLEAVHIQGGAAVLDGRLCRRILSSCAGRSAGDVILPSGDRTLVGSTWRVIGESEARDLGKREVDDMLQNAAALLPSVRGAAVLRTYTGVRLQVPEADSGDRPFGLVPDLQVVEHRLHGEPLGAVTGILGKLTLFNTGARAVVDALIAQHGLSIPSRTRWLPLSAPRRFSGRQLAGAMEPFGG